MCLPVNSCYWHCEFPTSLKDEGIKEKQRGTEEERKTVLLTTCVVAHFIGADFIIKRSKREQDCKYRH